MRLKILLTVLLIFQTTFGVTIVETGPERYISLDEALEIAQNQFKDQDVDYYVLDDDLSGWSIFVDAEPMKGWEHDCFILTFSKKTTFVHNENVLVAKRKLTLPPEGNYVPLLVKKPLWTEGKSEANYTKKRASQQP